MKPRETPRVIPTTTSRLPSWLFIATVLVALLAVYALTQRRDELDEQALADMVENFEQGRAVGRAEVLGSVKAAWQAGLDEGRARCTLPPEQRP